LQIICEQVTGFAPGSKLVKGLTKGGKKYQWAEKYRENLNRKISDKLLREASIQATLQYLIAWMRNDENCEQNIQTFLRYGYYSDADIESMERQKYDKIITREEVTAMRTAQNKYRYMYSLREKQSALEGMPYHHDDEPPSDSKKYHFFDLCLFSQFYEQNHNTFASLWPLIDLFYFRKDFLEVTTSKLNYTDDLVHAFESLERLLSEITMLSKNNDNTRKFVIMCFQFLLFDACHKCTWYARMAKYLTLTAMSLPSEIPLNIQSRLFRFSVPFRKDLKTGICPIVLYSSDEIFRQSIFENQQEDIPIPDVNMIMFCILTRYMKQNPISKLPHWREKDFQGAKKFLLDKCQILTHLQPLELKYCDPEVYTKIRAIYKETNAVDKKILSYQKMLCGKKIRNSTIGCYFLTCK